MSLNNSSYTAKIIKLRIENFLSLKKIEVELNKLNVFVGPNTSGKSNFVRALQLLANHVRNGVPSLHGYKSFKDLAYNFDETASIILEVKTKINNHNILYILTITVNNYIEQAWIDNKVALRSEGKKKVAQILTRDGVMKDIGIHTSASSNILGVTLFKSIFTNLPTDAVSELYDLAHLLRSITVHSFVPERIRAYSEITAKPSLGYYGDNIARVLLHLYLENRKVFTDIEDVMRSLIPEIKEIIPHIEGTKVEIWLRTRNLTEPLKPANISDGTLRILAYVTALYSGASLVVFEEPENCIHPHLLEAIVDLARKAPCQVIMTTHSPYLLDHIKPEEVYVVEKPRTETIVKKLSKTKELQAVKKLLEEGGTLGEAWYSGIIGGVPETT